LFVGAGVAGILLWLNLGGPEAAGRWFADLILR
jgi:hypothetical protein